MLEQCSLALICPAKRSFMGECVPYLLVLMNHPDLEQDHKFLYLWLLFHCYSQSSDSCVLSYDELSQRLNKSAKKIHLLLFRLKTMGFLDAAIPIWYGELTPAMITVERILTPILLSEKEYQYRMLLKEEHENRTFIWRKYDNMR